MANCSAVYYHNNKKKNKDKTFFIFPRCHIAQVALAQVWIAKLKREKDNLPKNVWVCSHDCEDDCFGSSWILQSSLTYPERPIRRRLHTGGVPTKFPYKQTKVKERNASKNKIKTVVTEKFVRFLGFKSHMQMIISTHSFSTSAAFFT